MPYSKKRYGSKKKYGKYQRCVKKVKKKGTAKNPYAVCRSAVYKTKKKRGSNMAKKKKKKR